MFEHKQIRKVYEGETGEIHNLNYPLPYPKNINVTVQIQVRYRVKLFTKVIRILYVY